MDVILTVVTGLGDICVGEKLDTYMQWKVDIFLKVLFGFWGAV